MTLCGPVGCDPDVWRLGFTAFQASSSRCHQGDNSSCLRPRSLTFFCVFTPQHQASFSHRITFTANYWGSRSNQLHADGLQLYTLLGGSLAYQCMTCEALYSQFAGASGRHSAITLARLCLATIVNTCDPHLTSDAFSCENRVKIC